MLISSVFRGQIKVEDAELGTVRDVRGEGKPDKCGVLEDIGEVGEVWRVELSSMLNVSERSHNIRDKKKRPQIWLNLARAVLAQARVGFCEVDGIEPRLERVEGNMEV